MTAKEAVHVDNAATDSYGALLFRKDPTGKTAGVMERVCDLAPEDYERYSGAYKVMFDIMVANMFTYVKQSSIDLFETIKKASDAMRDGEISPMQPDGMVEWGTRLRTAILAVCSSIHHHQDQSYIEVKRKFGKDSPEHRKVKAAFAEIYDDCFGYRYLYKLRNTMVHYTMEAAAMRGEAQLYKGEKIAFVDMQMDRSALLDMKDHLNAPLKEELRSLPGDPSIHEMVGEAVPRLAKTNRELLAILYPEIDDLCAIVREFDALFDGQKGVRAVIHQQSPELRPPFRTGLTSWADNVIANAHAAKERS